MALEKKLISFRKRKIATWTEKGPSTDWLIQDWSVDWPTSDTHTHTRSVWNVITQRLTFFTNWSPMMNSLTECTPTTWYKLKSYWLAIWFNQKHQQTTTTSQEKRKSSRNVLRLVYDGKKTTKDSIQTLICVLERWLCCRCRFQERVVASHLIEMCARVCVCMKVIGMKEPPNSTRRKQSKSECNKCKKFLLSRRLVAELSSSGPKRRTDLQLSPSLSQLAAWTITADGNHAAAARRCWWRDSKPNTHTHTCQQLTFKDDLN